MAFKVELEMNESIVFKCDYDKAFDLFMDAGKMSTFNPSQESYEDLGDNKYKYTMKKAGVSKYSMQLIYACQYEFDKENGIIKWTPIKGVGNGISSGDIKVKKTDGGVAVDFYTKLIIEVPFSKLAKAIITPFVKKEFKDNVATINNNLKNALES